MQFVCFRAMNTDILLATEGQGSASLQAAQTFIETSERRFSRFLPESELSQLNRSAGRWADVSDDLLDLLRQSMDFWRASHGLFDPSILPDLKRAGYDRSMDAVRARGDQPVPAALPTSKPSLDQMELDLDHQRVRLPLGMELDLGGIAKGWIAEQAVQVLSADSDACAVNAGGDMYFLGHPSDAEDWQVDLEDPRAPDSILASFAVDGGGVATSSVRKRTWTQGGQPRHHLIDPRTGQSAQSGWLSVTVSAPHLSTADVFAKVLLIGGADAIPMLPPDTLFLAVDSAGQWSGTLDVNK
jgi:thiamine biosynthesis lipoprotein